MTWVELKDYLSQISHLHQDALHIYAALGVQLLAVVVLRRPFSSVVSWLAVLAAEIGNETLDLLEPGKPFEAWQMIAGVHDMWNTMVLPTALLLICRFAPALAVGKKRLALRAE